MLQNDLEQHPAHPNEGWCSLVLVRVYSDGCLPTLRFGETGDVQEEVRATLPMGYVLVTSPYLERKAKYKLPGGRKEQGELPLCTAIRELHIKTGLLVSSSRFSQAGRWTQKRKGKTWQDFIFIANVLEGELAYMNPNHPGNKRCAPKFFEALEFHRYIRTPDFLVKHYLMLRECGAIF